MDSFPAAPDESASLDLVARIQGGERGAWQELYARYHDQLLLAVRLRLGPGLRAWLQSEDVFQSVAKEALSALPRFEYRGPGSLERFLKTLVNNKIRDRADTFGAQKRSGSVPLSDSLAASLVAPPTGSPAEASPGYYDAATYARLERALAQLPDEQREVLLLRKVDGLSSQEVAERTGRSDDAVRKATSRALARLATLMSEE